MKKQISIILLVFFAFGFAFAQNDLQPLATIKLNKTESVTLKQLKARCEVMKKQTGMTSFTVEQKQEILDSLIDEKLIIQAAAKAGLNLTDSQIQELYLSSLSSQVGTNITEQQFASLVKEQTGLSLDDFFMQQLSMTKAEYKQFLKNQYIAQQYVVYQKQSELQAVAATDTEVRNFYDMNQGQFWQADILKLFLFVVPKSAEGAAEKANNLYNSVKGSVVNFDELKINATKDGSYQVGDMYVSKNNTAATQLGIDYTELLNLFKMKVGDISELTETASDYQFFIVRETIPGKLLTLSDVVQPDSNVTVYEYIREKLTEQKQNLYYTQAVEEIITSIRTPENVQMLKSGDSLTKLLENW